MGWFDDEQRLERQHRRQVVADWKEIANDLRDTASERGKKLLLREARREALIIIEDAARTLQDFENILAIWDKMESIEADRVGKHENTNVSTMLNYGLPEHKNLIFQPIDRVYCRQELKGNFLDTIYDCPHELHETTACKLASEMAEALSELHKELLYYRSIRHWSPQQIAAVRGCTDRNVRKVYNKMMADMRYELFYYLYWHYKKYLPITTTHRKFVISCVKKHGAAKEKEVDWELNEGDHFDTDEDSESEDSV